MRIRIICVGEQSIINNHFIFVSKKKKNCQSRFTCCDFRILRNIENVNTRSYLVISHNDGAGRCTMDCSYDDYDVGDTKLLH